MLLDKSLCYTIGMIGTVLRDLTGKIISTPSSYNPDDVVRTLTAGVRDDYLIGNNIWNSPLAEFNYRSPRQAQDDDQQAFNSYIPARSTNPDEEWRYRGVRPLTRNKIISIAAHVLSATLVPSFFAQNDQDEEDKDAAEVMRTLMEWVIHNSNYEEAMFGGILAALVSPVTYLHPDFCKAIQTIKELQANGEYVDKKVVDDILSGFQSFTVPAEEIFITNVNEPRIQRQRAIIRRRFIDYTEAKALYGEHPSFVNVRPGVRVFYSDDEKIFYEQYDDENPSLVEEVTYYNRGEDRQICFVNGILVTRPDQRIKHRTATDRPRYPYAKFGYELIHERFYFYKSAVSKLGPDQNLVDQLYSLIMDGTFLSLMPPVAVMGDEEVNTSIIFPGAVTNFAKETKIEPINTGMNLAHGFNAMALVEKSMSESSQDSLQQGVQGASGRTAFEIAKLEQNARTQLGLFGKMISNAVVDFGELMSDLIVNHMTTGEINQISDKMTFRRFAVSSREGDGKTKRVDFTADYLGKGMTEDEEIKESFDILNEEGGLDAKTRIYRVNPYMFSRLKYKVYVTADVLKPKSDAFEKAIKLEAYDRLINNPYVSQEQVTREFLVPLYTNGDPDRLMLKSPEQGMTIPVPNQGSLAAGAVKASNGTGSLASSMQ